MKRITTSLVLFLSLIFGYGQCPNIDIELVSQTQVDKFAIIYPNCTELTHEVIVNGESSLITNLNGFQSITNAQRIFVMNTQVSSLNGLHNLLNADHIALWGNGNLTDLSGLTSIQSIGGLEILANSSLTNLVGMDNIQTIDDIYLFSNASLSDLTELSFIETLNSLLIVNNNLNSLSGLENLTMISGDLNISHEQLSDIDELSNLQHIGGSLHITYLDDLKDLTAFSNIETLENLFLLDCHKLWDLTGLSNIHTVYGKFRIGFNSGLTSLAGVYNLYSVGDLDIYENENLNSLKGLGTLQKITNRLFINKNPSLFSIKDLNDVSVNAIEEVAIILNSNLSVCSNELICTIIDDPSVIKTFFNNAPGCSSYNEVKTSCDNWGGLINIDLDEQIGLYPNPVSDQLNISLTEGVLFKKVIIYTISNEKVYESFEDSVNLSMLPKGIYFVEIETDKGTVVKKIIKS